MVKKNALPSFVKMLCRITREGINQSNISERDRMVAIYKECMVFMLDYHSDIALDANSHEELARIIAQYCDYILGIPSEEIWGEILDEVDNV